MSIRNHESSSVTWNTSTNPNKISDPIPGKLYRIRTTKFPLPIVTARMSHIVTDGGYYRGPKLPRTRTLKNYIMIDVTTNREIRVKSLARIVEEVIIPITTPNPHGTRSKHAK